MPSKDPMDLNRTEARQVTSGAVSEAQTFT
jgi:hypothetical protein